MTEILIYECPWCSTSIQIVAVNCNVYRCGQFKDTGDQLPPHMPEKESEELKESYWGCGKPITLQNGQLVKCAWI
jgi:hypothetical protein